MEQDREPHFLYWSRTEPIKQVHVPRGSTNPAKPEMEIRFRQSPLLSHRNHLSSICYKSLLTNQMNSGPTYVYYHIWYIHIYDISSKFTFGISSFMTLSPLNLSQSALGVKSDLLSWVPRQLQACWHGSFYFRTNCDWLYNQIFKRTNFAKLLSSQFSLAF